MHFVFSLQGFIIAKHRKHEMEVLKYNKMDKLTKNKQNIKTTPLFLQ